MARARQRSWVAAEVVAHDRPVDDIAIIAVRPEHPVAYLPGQALPVRTAHHPSWYRWYAPANAPRPDATIELHVRAVPNGRVSSPLVREVRPGDVLKLGEPAGSGLVLDPYARRDLLLVAAGTGLAPLRALVEQLGSVGGDGRRVTLVVGVRTIPELYDADSLVELQRRHAWLELIAAVSHDRHSLPGETGTAVDVAVEHTPATGWIDHDVYVCGPDPMVRETARRLTAAGVPPAQLHLPDALASTVPRRRSASRSGLPTV